MAVFLNGLLVPELLHWYNNFKVTLDFDQLLNAPPLFRILFVKDGYGRWLPVKSTVFLSFQDLVCELLDMFPTQEILKEMI